MAKIELCFNDLWFENSRASIEMITCDGVEQIEISFYDGSVCAENLTSSFNLDKSTAIKFAKTLRTEINKIEDINNDKK